MKLLRHCVSFLSQSSGRGSFCCSQVCHTLVQRATESASTVHYMYMTVPDKSQASQASRRGGAYDRTRPDTGTVLPRLSHKCKSDHFCYLQAGYRTAYAGTVRCTYGMVQLHTSGRYNIRRNVTKSERYKNGSVHDFSL